MSTRVRFKFILSNFAFFALINLFIQACQFKLTANNKEIEVVEDSVIEKGTEGAWKKFTSSLPENVSNKFGIT